MCVAKREDGFSLVELAIAMTVIGLLLAGLLKSTELIENSRVSSLVSQAGHYETAVTAFRSLYSALPGDMTDPARVNDCSGYCAVSGNGDGLIYDSDDENYRGGYLSGESRRVWIQLARANLISSVDQTNDNSVTRVAGVDYPAPAFPGGMFDLQFNRTAQSASAPLAEMAHYLKTRSAPIDDNRNNLLSAQQAQKVDMKMDDGYPRTGRVIGWRWVSSAVQTCGNYTSNQYNLTDRAQKCDISIKMNF